MVDRSGTKRRNPDPRPELRNRPEEVDPRLRSFVDAMADLIVEDLLRDRKTK